MRKMSLLCIVLLGASCMLAQAEPAAPVSVTEFSANSLNAQNADLGAVAPKQIRQETGDRLRPEPQQGSRQGGDICASATPIGSLPYDITGTTAGYTDDYDEVCNYTGSTSPDVAYSYHPVDDIYITIDLCDSGYDTKVYIYEGACPGTLIACNDDACGGTYRSQLFDVALTGGNTYYIIVDGWGGENGAYHMLVIEGDTPPPVPECPEGSLFSQEPVLSDGAWSFGNTEVTEGYQRFDEYSVEGLICDIHWWGSPLFHDGTNWVACDENPMGFIINFYPDDGGVPAATPTCTYEVTAAGTGTGILYADTYELFAYEIALLDPCCALESGWLSIQGAGDPDCWFMWLNSLDSPDGNNSSLFYINGTPDPAEAFDLAFCLTGQGTPGACCDDTTGECVDGVLYTECAGRWAEGLCADIDPACGDATGACCYPESCEILTYAQCNGVTPCPGDMDCDGDVDFDDIDPFVLALGGEAGYLAQWPDCLWLNGDCDGDDDVDFDDIDFFVARIGQMCDAGARDAGIWLGPDTTCDMCPCILACPPGGLPEGEPCGEDLNGGCNSDPAVFEPISCADPGNTVCGTAWAADGTRDTDWYELVLEDCAIVTVTVASEFASVFGVIEQGALGHPGCDNITGFINPVNSTDDCVEATVTTVCLPIGTYYFFVAPSAYDGLSCDLGSSYYINVVCEACDCCDVECVGTPEGEPVCADEYDDTFNGGCNSTTPVYTDIDCNVTICGEAGTFEVAGVANRDTDWYHFVGAAPGAPNNGYQFTWTVEAEFEASIFVVAMTSGCDSLTILDSTTGDRCTPISLTTGCIPINDDVEIYFLVMPSNFVGVACGAEYAASLTCSPCEVCIIVPADPGLDEGEACGAAEGEAGYNGGCNNDGVPTFTTFPAPWGSPGTQYVNGTAWADGGTRDTDWYTVTVAQSSTINWSVIAEFPVLIGMVYPDEMGVVDCDNHLGLVQAATGNACEDGVGPGPIYVPAGEYMLFVAPSDFEGAPCGFAGNHYKAKLTVAAADYYTCNVVFTALPNENEPDCTDGYVDTFNGGCDFTPNNFMTLECELGWEARVGTFTGGLGRDTDWYQIQIDDWAVLNLDYNAEFDIRLDLYDAALGCEAEPIAGFYGLRCEEQDDLGPCIEPGIYWIKVYPATTAPAAIPCNNPARGAYWLLIETCAGCNLDCVTGTCDGTENETCENNDVNGGCTGNQVFDPFVPGLWYCGTLDYVSSRDFDWWQYSGFAVDTPVTVQWRAEVPAKPVMLTQPTAAGCDGPWWHLSATQATCEDLTWNSPDDVLAGFPFNVLWLITGDQGNESGYGFPVAPLTFPCGEGLNDYRFRIVAAAAAPAQTEKQASSSERPASIPDRYIP